MGYLELSGAASQSSEGGEAGLVGEGAHAVAHKVAGGGRDDAPAAKLTPLRRAAFMPCIAACLILYIAGSLFPPVSGWLQTGTSPFKFHRLLHGQQLAHKWWFGLSNCSHTAVVAIHL